MTKEEVKSGLESTNPYMGAQFNNYMKDVDEEYRVYFYANTGDKSDDSGAALAAGYLVLSDGDKDWVKDNASNFGVKHPCD